MCVCVCVCVCGCGKGGGWEVGNIGKKSYNYSPDEWQHGIMVSNTVEFARMSSVIHPLQHFLEWMSWML